MNTPATPIDVPDALQRAPDVHGVTAQAQAAAAAPASVSPERDAIEQVLGEPKVPPHIVDDLLLLMLPRNLRAGDRVMSRQSIAASLMLLARGEMVLGLAEADGRFHAERTVLGPAWLDATSVWLGQPHVQDAVALTDALVLDMPRDAFQMALARHAELALRLLTDLSRQMHAMIATTQDLMHKDAEARFAVWLLQRCATSAEHPNRAMVELHERKRDIAAQLAITPETLSRLLRQLVRKGLIEVYGYTVNVRDVKALKRLAGGA